MTSPSDLKALYAEVRRTGQNLRRMRNYWGKRPTQRLIKSHQRHLEALQKYRAALEEVTKGSHP